MNPKGIYKQNMNVRNGWILCSSKTFPGKCYYFNVHTGEAAWNCNDVEKPRYMGPNMAPEQNKFYPYPEPSSPPMFMPYQPQPYQPQPYFNQGFQNLMTPPRFGNATFRNYLPYDYPPMHTNYNFNQYMPEPYFPNLPQKMPQEKLPDFKCFVQATALPMNKRITNYKFPYKINVHDKNQEKDDYCVPEKRPRLANQIDPSKVEIIRKFLLSKPNPKPQNKEQIYQKHNQDTKINAEREQVMVRNLDQSKPRTEVENVCKCSVNHAECDRTNIGYNHETVIEYNHGITEFDELYNESQQLVETDINQQQNQTVQQELDKTESFQELRYQELEKSNIQKDRSSRLMLSRSLFSPAQDFEEPTKLQENVLESKEKKLPESDLRLKLLAKRKIGTTAKEEENKGISNSLEKENPPKKKVSFYLNNLKEDFESAYDEDQNGQYENADKFPLHHSTPTKVLESDTDDINTEDSDIFFVISDTDILLDHWTTLDSLLKSDNKYKILLPQKVLRELDRMSLGDCRGRHNVMRGRHVTRLIALMGDKIVKEYNDDTYNVSFDPIIECCLRTYEEGYHAILLSNDKEYEVKAKQNCITYFNIKEIKDFLTAEQKTVTFSNKNSENFLEDNNSQSPILESKNLRQNNDFKPASPILECKSPKLNRNTQNFNEKVTSKIENIDKNEKEVSKDLIKENSNSKKTIEYNILDELMPKMGDKFKIPKVKTTPKYKCNTDPRKKSSGNIENLKKEIEEGLKGFSINHDVFEERLRSRKDEWVCRYTQIMEDAFTSVLMESTSPYIPQSPWSLPEACQCLREKYSDNLKVVMLAEKLADTLSQFQDKGAIKADIDLADFMTIFGLGVILIETLMEIPELNEILKEPNCNLRKILKDIEDPTTDDTMKSLNLNYHHSIDFDEIIMDEGRKVKNTADVAGYLRRHYPHLKEYYMEDTEDNYEEGKEKSKAIKILRTVGKNIDRLTFSSGKQISMEEPKTDFMKSFENGNTFDDKKLKSDTKVIRKINVIREFEDKIKKNDVVTKHNETLTKHHETITGYNEKITQNNKVFDLDVLDYEETTSTMILNNDTNNGISNELLNDLLLSDVEDSVENKIPHQTESPSVLQYNNNEPHNDNHNGDNDNENNASDSGLVLSDESEHVQSVVKMFFNEIKNSFLIVYNFIKSSAQVIRERELSENKKKRLINNTNIALEHVINVTSRIKSIISREESDWALSLAALAMRTTLSRDVRVHRYRQVLTKCLEQADVLRASLVILNSAIKEDYAERDNDVQALLTSVPYYNIYE